MLTYPSPKLLFSFYFWSGKTFQEKKPQNISILLVAFGSFLNSGYCWRILHTTKKTGQREDSRLRFWQENK